MEILSIFLFAPFISSSFCFSFAFSISHAFLPMVLRTQTTTNQFRNVSVFRLPSASSFLILALLLFFLVYLLVVQLHYFSFSIRFILLWHKKSTTECTHTQVVTFHKEFLLVVAVFAPSLSLWFRFSFFFFCFSFCVDFAPFAGRRRSSVFFVLSFDVVLSFAYTQIDLRSITVKKLQIFLRFSRFVIFIFSFFWPNRNATESR